MIVDGGIDKYVIPLIENILANDVIEFTPYSLQLTGEFFVVGFYKFLNLHFFNLVFLLKNILFLAVLLDEAYEQKKKNRNVID